MWVACFLAQTPAAACLSVRSLPGGANTTSIAYLLRGQHVLPSLLQCPTEVLQVFSSVQCSACRSRRRSSSASPSACSLCKMETASEHMEALNVENMVPASHLQARLKDSTELGHLQHI